MEKGRERGGKYGQERDNRKEWKKGKCSNRLRGYKLQKKKKEDCWERKREENATGKEKWK